ncbi:AMP-binding protein [Streptosporangiaceae bacterium NEAU-GS5]|nr:AMP-binding protein [Streptosporangiaceae bacterium NEAU-GS5]
MHALVLPPGPELTDAVGRALDEDGPAVLPLSPDLPPPALEAALRALRPTHLVTGGRTRPLDDGVGVADEVAVVIATSGSTGTPKGVQLSGRALKASATASLRRVGARPGDRWLCRLPHSHVSGLQVLVRALLCGTDPIFDADDASAHHVSLVPTQLRRLLDAGADLAAYRTILLGGAAASPALLAEARAAGARLVTTYGMTETCGGCVYDGRALYKVDLKIGDDGRIRVAGPVLFSGYRFGPDPHLEDGWFVTSDLGELRDGRLSVFGRADDVINTGGHKVAAGTVAHVLTEHPRVREAAVAGRPDPEWGEIVVAVIAGEATLDEVRGFVKERLPAYAAPRAVHTVPAIPLLPNGKVDMVTVRNLIRHLGVEADEPGRTTA